MSEILDYHELTRLRVENEKLRTLLEAIFAAWLDGAALLPSQLLDQIEAAVPEIRH